MEVFLDLGSEGLECGQRNGGEAQPSAMEDGWEPASEGHASGQRNGGEALNPVDPKAADASMQFEGVKEEHNDDEEIAALVELCYGMPPEADAAAAAAAAPALERQVRSFDGLAEEAADATMPAEPGEPETQRMRGTVLKFAPTRGYGIIEPEGGGVSLFVHWTQLRSNDKWPQLLPGTAVEFEIRVEKGKNIAADISLPGGRPICMDQESSDACDKPVSDVTMTGTVSYFSWAGYGFIKTDEAATWPHELPAGSDIYVSREELVVFEGSSCNLSNGMRVQFRLYVPADKPVAAAEVTAIGGAPLVGISMEAGKGTTFASSSKGLGKGKSEVEGVQRTIQKPLVLGRIGRNAESPTCKFFAAGRCMRGDACTYSHTMAPAVAEGGDPMLPLQSVEATIAMLTAALSKVEAEADKRPLCKFFVEQRCTKGAACQFTHGDIDSSRLSQRSAAGFAAGTARASPICLRRPAQPGSPEYDEAILNGFAGSSQLPAGATPCKFFLAGRCSKGEACRFVHGCVGAVASTCTFFAQGRCTRGEACPYAHGLQEFDDSLWRREIQGVLNTGTLI